MSKTAIENSSHTETKRGNKEKRKASCKNKYNNQA